MNAENEQVVRRGYELFSKGDLGPAWYELYTENPVWRTPGLAGFQSEYKGVEAILGYYAQLGQLTGGMFTCEPECIMSDDQRVLVLHRTTASRGGKTMDMREVVVFEFAGGKVSAATEYYAEPKEAEAFWA